MIPLSFDEQKELLSERDEARQIARRLYKRLCDEHIAYISAKSVADYWCKRGPELQTKYDNLSEECETKDYQYNTIIEWYKGAVRKYDEARRELEELRREHEPN